MLKTKKGRILFFTITIITAIVAIVLVNFLLKEPALNLAKQNFDSYIDMYLRTDNKENDVIIDDSMSYYKKIVSYSELSTEVKQELNLYRNINYTLMLIKDDLSQNLAFTYRSNSYNSEANKVAKIYNDNIDNFKNFYSYCDTTIKPLFSINLSNEDINYFAKKFLEKYKEITKANLDMFLAIKDVINNSVVRGFGINEYSSLFTTLTIDSCVAVKDNFPLSSQLAILTLVNSTAFSKYTYTQSDIDELQAQYNIFNAQEEVWKNL